MKCLPCGFDAPRAEFKQLEATGGDWVSLVVSGLGAVSIYACPNCGALHTTLSGEIKMENRKS
jgi:hypothetical protein